MKIKTVDFNEFYDSAYFSQRFTRTRPVSFTFYKRGYVGSNWTDLYVKFFEMVYARYPQNIENLAFSGYGYGIRSVLFLDDGGKRNIPFRRLGFSNVCLKTGFNIEEMLENIAEIIRFLELDESQIVIQYADKKEIRLDSKLNPRNRNVNNSCSPSDFAGHSFLKFNGYPSELVDKRILSALRKNYAQGFRFDNTTLALLEAKTGYKLSDAKRQILKNAMYCRPDGVCFLNESVVTEDLCLRIAESANAALRKFMCFELKTLYERFVGELNPVCIRDAEDFENWFEAFFSGNIRIKKLEIGGTRRIVRVKSITQATATLSLVRKIQNELKKSFGTLEEETLLTTFDAFSLEFLTALIQKETDDVVVSHVNGRTCFQTFDALGVPDELPEKLSNTLEKIDELELEPTLDLINTLLSVAFDFNFKNNFNIPNAQTYRRLIETYYRGSPRLWKSGLFQISSASPVSMEPPF